MIYKNNLYRKALQIVKEIEKINFEYSGKISQNSIDKMSANLIVSFTLDSCEKQKGRKDNIYDTKIKL